MKKQRTGLWMFIVSIVLYSCKYTVSGDPANVGNHRMFPCHSGHIASSTTGRFTEGIISVKKGTGFAAFLNLSFTATDDCCAGGKSSAKRYAGWKVRNAGPGREIPFAKNQLENQCSLLSRVVIRKTDFSLSAGYDPELLSEPAGSEYSVICYR